MRIEEQPAQLNENQLIELRMITHYLKEQNRLSKQQKENRKFWNLLKS